MNTFNSNMYIYVKNGANIKECIIHPLKSKPKLLICESYSISLPKCRASASYIFCFFWMTHSLAFTLSALCISNKDPANEIPIHVYFPLHKFTNLDVLDPVQKVSKFVQIEICNKLPFFFFFTRLPCPCFFKAAKRRMQRQNLYLRTTKCVPHFPKYI